MNKPTNDSDFDLAMQNIWTNGALISEKISEDVSSIIYSESDVMMLSDKATDKGSYKWETNSGQLTNMNKHGSTGNTYASKEVTKSSVLTVRCYPHEKAAWVNAAKGQKLAEWVTSTLNKSAKKDHE
jgi:hypothetical protein